MDILNPKNLRQEADRALARGREPKKIVLAYALALLALSLLGTLLVEFFGSLSSDQGGLSNLGAHAIYQTAQQVVPLATSLVSMCLELGFLGAMMRVSRGQYADHTDLKVGFSRFWPLLRLTLLQAGIYLAVGILAVQAASMIFLMSPWAQPLAEAIADLNTTDLTTLDESTLLSLMELMGPVYLIAAVVFLALIIPVLHRLRMANYCLLDDPQGRALSAIRTSSRMMRRRFLPMLKIDLRLWIYHLGTLVVGVTMYLDLILVSLGVTLPLEGKLFSLLVYGVALVMQLALQLTLRCRAELTYLKAYEKLQEKPKDSGVVLGNIFDM